MGMILEKIEFSEVSPTVLKVDEDVKQKLPESRGHFCLTHNWSLRGDR